MSNFYYNASDVEIRKINSPSKLHYIYKYGKEVLNNSCDKKDIYRVEM